MTDEELVARAQRGDVSAFEQLVSRHEGAVYRAAMSALRVREEAEEAAQDAFVRAWKHIGRFRGDASFRTWLLSIVWNGALSRRRSVMRWWTRHADLQDALAVAHGVRSADLQIHDADLMRRIAQAIEALSPKLRDALLLVQTGEYTYEEIAAALAIPLGTVKWRVSEARKQIKARLTAEGYVDAR